MIINIQIKNWAKYNPRSDVKSCSWFRMDNDFFADAEFYKTSIEVRIVWIFVMCQASKKMATDLKINLNMVSDQTGLTQDVVKNSIDSLVLIGCIIKNEVFDISTRSDSNVPQMFPSATNERTDERTNIREPIFSGFGSDECFELWEALGNGDYENLAKAKMMSGVMCSDFANLKSKFLKTREDWEMYFKSLDNTARGDEKGFSLPTALKETTYTNLINSVYGKRKVTQENPFEH